MKTTFDEINTQTNELVNKTIKSRINLALGLFARAGAVISILVWAGFMYWNGVYSSLGIQYNTLPVDNLSLLYSGLVTFKNIIFKDPTATQVVFYVAILLAYAVAFPVQLLGTVFSIVAMLFTSIYAYSLAKIPEGIKIKRSDVNMARWNLHYEIIYNKTIDWINETFSWILMPFFIVPITIVFLGCISYSSRLHGKAHVESGALFMNSDMVSAAVKNGDKDENVLGVIVGCSNGICLIANKNGDRALISSPNLKIKSPMKSQ